MCDMKSSFTVLFAIAISCVVAGFSNAQVRPAEAPQEVQKAQTPTKPVRVEKTTAEFSTAVNQNARQLSGLNDALTSLAAQLNS